MKHFTLRLRTFLLLCSILIVSLCFQSSLLAQTNKQVTPGTSASLSTSSKTISSAVAATGLQQFYSSTGHYTLSADGVGSTSSSMNIRVNKPNAQATVEKAILISAVTGTSIGDGCVTIAGVPVNWDGTAAASGTVSFNNYWADVTSIVASTINAFPAGQSTLPITECSSGFIDGEALLVVFNDPSAAEKTVIVMIGGENPQGDNFSVTLAKPINPSAPGALLDMGLGIGFSYQSNGTNQASQVSVNGQRISSSAGGEDDGEPANGALLTVGGIGDADDNPADPFALPTNPRSDDELYSILPFIDSTTTSLTINTINPSLDDNIFLAYFVTSGAAIVGEGILLSQASDTGNVGDNHTVNATVVNSLGLPVTDRLVTFTVTSGPNAGNTFSATTDASGTASYTYTGTGGVGTDSVQACFLNSQNETDCSNVLPFVWVSTSDCDPNYQIHIGVIPKYTVKGQDEHTIYIGYGPQSVALLAAHHGGNAPFTYLWNDGNINHLRVVSPDTTTTYSVTITDAHGCKKMCQVTIYVVDVRCTTTAGNIYVCNGGQTMSVAKKDVQGWLDQGATLGQCSIVPLTAANRTVSAAALKPVTVQAAGAFSIYPNPAVSSVTLKWNTVLTGNAKVVITDLQGRILMTQSVSGSSKTITVSQLASGVYMAKLVTADKTVATSRLVVSK